MSAPLLRPCLAVLALLLVTSCQGPRADLRIAVDPHHPPLAFLDAHDQMVGYEIDLFREVASAEGWSVEFVAVPTNGLIRGVEDLGIFGGLDRGDWDLVVSAVPESNQLRDLGSLSVPYLNVGPVLVTRRAAPVTLGADWQGGLGVTEWGTALTAVRLTDVPAFWRRSYRDEASALEDLAEGVLSGVVASRVAVAATLADNEKLQLLLQAGAPLSADEQLVAVARKGDERLAAINDRLKAVEASGRAEELQRLWWLR